MGSVAGQGCHHFIQCRVSVRNLASFRIFITPIRFYLENVYDGNVFLYVEDAWV